MFSRPLTGFFCHRATGILAIIGLFMIPAVAVPAAAGPASTLPSTYIVTLSSAPADVHLVAAEHARTLGLTIRFLYRSALVGYAAEISDAALRELRTDPRVISLELDRAVFVPSQVGGPKQEVPLGIDRVDAELSKTAAIDGVDQPLLDVDVAVLDTGIDVDHPELNVVGGTDCIGGDSYDDPHGHGTHIAGVIGARDDGLGVVGVAPGVRLWAVRVLDEEAVASSKQVLCGIDWVTATRTDAVPDNDIEVANFSLNTGGRDDGECGWRNHSVLHQAICRSVAAGVTYVVSAGNESRSAARFVPAAYDEVITVSALADSDGRPGGEGKTPSCHDDVDDTLADFSNIGADVDLIAPGVCILSTAPIRGPLPPLPGSSDGYGTRTGTSFAAPHVAGAAALYVATHPGAAPAEVRAGLVAGGNRRWDAHEDVDGVKEPLLNAEEL